MENKSNRNKTKKKLAIIANCGQAGFKKWRCNELEKFLPFLTKTYPNWSWYEVYNNISKERIEMVINPEHEKQLYACIVKVGKEDFKKWHTNDLLSITQFLDKEFSNWHYFNVFSTQTRIQIASFTKTNRPLSNHI
jgi:hypothetical protein